MLKIHKISDIRSVEAYLLDNVKPYDIIIADDYNPYEIKRSLLNKREAGVVFDVQFTSILRLAKKYGAKILQASTSEVYGDPKQHPQKEDYWGKC